MPIPWSATEKRSRSPDALVPDVDDPAVRRVLDRVLDQVAENLAQLLGVCRDRGRDALVDDDLDLGREVGSRGVDRPLERLAGVAALDLESELLGVEPAREEDVVHDPGQPVRLARDHAEQARTLLCGERVVALDQRHRGAVHRGERGPQLVRDRRDEVAADLLEGALLGQVAEGVDGALGQADAGDREPELAPADLDRERLRAPSGRGRLGSDGNPRGQLPPSRDDAGRHSRRARCSRRRPVIASAAGFQSLTIPSLSIMKTPSPTWVRTSAARARSSVSRCSRALSTASPARRAISSASGRSASVYRRPGLRPGERDRADDVASRDHRQRHRRAGRELLHQLVVPLVPSRRLQRRGVEVVEDHWPPLAEGNRRRLRRLERGHVRAAQLLERAPALLATGRDRHAVDLVALEHVHDAPVRERRQGEAGDALQRVVVVERGRERAARVGQETLLLLVLDRAAGRAARSRPRFRPGVPAPRRRRDPPRRRPARTPPSSGRRSRRRRGRERSAARPCTSAPEAPG